MFTATERGSRPGSYLGRLLILTLVPALALAAPQDNATHPADYINGPPPLKQSPAPDPGQAKNLPGVPVHGNYFDVGLIAPTGNGAVYNGHEFTTANTLPSTIPHANKNPCDQVGDPILPKTGSKVEAYPLFALPGEMGLKLVLYYNTSRLGAKWSTNLDYWLDLNCEDTPNLNGPCNYLSVYRPDGSKFKFGKSGVDAGGSPPSPTNITKLALDSTTGNYVFHDEDATTQIYDSNGHLIAITDASGIGWTISKSGGTTTVTHTNGQSIQLETVVSGTPPIATVTITDPAGNPYTVVYGTNGGSIEDVSSITFPGSPSTVISFKYSTLPTSPFLVVMSAVEYNGVPHSYTSYDTTAGAYYGWATGTHLADGSEDTSISYGTDANGFLVATVTNSLGHQSARNYAGTLGSGGAANGELSLVSESAVQTCGATVRGFSYDVNDHISEEIDNNGNVHTFTYAANGQLQAETEAYGTPISRTTDYTWDPNVLLNRKLSETVEGLRKTTYTYDAHNRLASVAVTNLTGNGAVNQTLTTTYGYSLYANGMVQTVTVTHPSPNNSDTDTYSYDALGNLVSLSNGLGQTTTYSNYNGLGEVGHVVGPNGDATDYTYDARGRVVTKTTYPNGSAATWAYAYDGFGQLHTLTGSDGQVTTWTRDPSTMRVMSITHNDKDGVSTESFTYDANGDMTQHTLARGSMTSLIETYTYDALGRVYQKFGQHGQSLTYAYDGNGNVLSIADAVGHTIAYQYDALDRVTTKSESGGASPPIPSIAPSINVPSISSNGSYIVNWNSVTAATAYILQEQANGGSWTTIQNGAALSWGASGKSNGTYSYRVQGCDVTGCGPWSGVGGVTVVYPPSTPTLTAPAFDATGSYAVSWDSVATATSYTLQEQIDGGGWTTVQSGGNTSWNAGGKTVGTYGYQVQACNAGGCSAWSAVSAVTEQLPPGSPPRLGALANSSTGSYTVNWISVSQATSYVLQEQINGGSWATVQSSNAIAWNATDKANGSYSYRVQSCNGGDCSAWSSTVTTTVLLPPSSAPSISVPASSGIDAYTISWSSVATATSYNLQEQINGGSWITVQSSNVTSWSVGGRGNGTYGYQVQACNTSGCGPWSVIGSISVLLPPGSAPSLSVPTTNSTGSYTVSWSGVSTAASYNLQEQVDGGGWSAVQSSGASSWLAGHSNGAYDYRVQACNASGCGPWSGTSSTVVTIPVPIAINGNSYSQFASISGSSGTATIGVMISGGTWQIYGAAPAGNSVKASGSVPATAVAVQYTWTYVGVPVGDADAGGAVINGAASPIALANNPSSHYTTGSYGANSPTRGRNYRLQVDFYNSAGANVSSSTCTLTAETQGING